MRSRTAIAALTSAALGLAVLTASPAAAASRALAWDFNGDGYRDLVVGMPNETVTKLRERCRSVGRCGQLDAVLERSFGIGYENLHQYRERRQLRSTPYLVPITEAFPRVLRTDLLNLPYDDMSRVTDIRYRVNVDGLGWEDGTAAFFDVIPEGT